MYCRRGRRWRRPSPGDQRAEPGSHRIRRFREWRPDHPRAPSSIPSGAKMCSSRSDTRVAMSQRAARRSIRMPRRPFQSAASLVHIGTRRMACKAGEAPNERCRCIELVEELVDRRLEHRLFEGGRTRRRRRPSSLRVGHSLPLTGGVGGVNECPPSDIRREVVAAQGEPQRMQNARRDGGGVVFVFERSGPAEMGRRVARRRSP